MFEQIVPLKSRQRENTERLVGIEETFRTGAIEKSDLIIYLQHINNVNIVGNDYRMTFDDIGEALRLSTDSIHRFLMEQDTTDTVIARMRWYYKNFEQPFTLLKKQFNVFVEDMDSPLTDQDYISVAGNPLSTKKINDPHSVIDYLKTITKVPWYYVNKTTKVKKLCGLLDVNYKVMDIFLNSPKSRYEFETIYTALRKYYRDNTKGLSEQLV